MTLPNQSDSDPRARPGYYTEGLPTPVVYCVTPDKAAFIIDTAIALGAPLVKGARSGAAWQVAVGFVTERARQGRRFG